MQKSANTRRRIARFLRINYKPMAGLLAGSLVGYLHWYYFGMQWGTAPLSSECWVNCIYGSLFGGLITCLIAGKPVD
jgi:hypothetical protein